MLLIAGRADGFRGWCIGDVAGQGLDLARACAFLAGGGRRARCHCPFQPERISAHEPENRKPMMITFVILVVVFVTGAVTGTAALLRLGHRTRAMPRRHA
jgi:hypothetical protein